MSMYMILIWIKKEKPEAVQSGFFHLKVKHRDATPNYRRSCAENRFSAYKVPHHNYYYYVNDAKMKPIATSDESKLGVLNKNVGCSNYDILRIGNEEYRRRKDSSSKCFYSMQASGSKEEQNLRFGREIKWRNTPCHCFQKVEI